MRQGKINKGGEKKDDNVLPLLIFMYILKDIINFTMQQQISLYIFKVSQEVTERQILGAKKVGSYRFS